MILMLVPTQLVHFLRLLALFVGHTPPFLVSQLPRFPPPYCPSWFVESHSSLQSLRVSHFPLSLPSLSQRRPPFVGGSLPWLAIFLMMLNGNAYCQYGGTF